MKSVPLIVLLAAGLSMFSVIGRGLAGPGQPTMPMNSQMPMGTQQDPTPAVKGFYQGQEITFIHTEASDPLIAEMLTRMMGPKVLVVPSLREVPVRLLAEVFVFTNGVKGEGPFGFQPDVFDAVPGERHYTPLRRVNLVTWKDGTRPRALRSVEEIRDGRVRGILTVRQPGAVVNVPFLTWPGGTR